MTKPGAGKVFVSPFWTARKKAYISSGEMGCVWGGGRLGSSLAVSFVCVVRERWRRRGGGVRWGVGRGRDLLMTAVGTWDDRAWAQTLGFACALDVKVKNEHNRYLYKMYLCSVMSCCR